MAVAVLADGVLAFDDTQIASGPVAVGGHFQATLTGATTQNVGDRIVGTGDRPLAGRVIAVNGMTVTYDLVPMTELFTALDVAMSYDPAMTSQMLVMADNEDALGGRDVRG